MFKQHRVLSTRVLLPWYPGLEQPSREVVHDLHAVDSGLDGFMARHVAGDDPCAGGLPAAAFGTRTVRAPGPEHRRRADGG